jgi:hypothetical protein
MGLGWLVDFWRSKNNGKLRWTAFSGVAFYLVLHVVVFSVMYPYSWLPWAKLLFTKT